MDEERDDPWAGGLFSCGRREQFKEMERLWAILSKGDPGFTLTFTLPRRSARLSKMIKRLGRQVAADVTQMALNALMEKGG